MYGDRHALGGLELNAEITPYKLGERDKNVVYTFAYPEQEHGFEKGDEALDSETRGKRAGGGGEVISCDDLTGTLEIKVSPAIAPRLKAILPAKPLDIKKKQAAIEAIAATYRAGKLDEQWPATAALLLGRTPRLSDRSQGATLQPRDVNPSTVSATVRALDGSYLVVQGPPGSGKTTTGARVVVDLLASGKRVALAAFTHKALHNLLRKVEETAVERGVTFRELSARARSKMARSTSSLATPRPPPAHRRPRRKPMRSMGCDLVSATTSTRGPTKPNGGRVRCRRRRAKLDRSRSPMR